MREAKIDTGCEGGQFADMSTVKEIENAVEALPREEQSQLLVFLIQRLRADDNLPEPRKFSDEQLQAWMDEDEADMRRFRAGA